VFIPDNGYGIPRGYYSQREIALLLREHCCKPQTVHFIADMME
jgi:hypothetical protein